MARSVRVGQSLRLSTGNMWNTFNIYLIYFIYKSVLSELVSNTIWMTNLFIRYVMMHYKKCSRTAMQQYDIVYPGPKMSMFSLKPWLPLQIMKMVVSSIFSYYTIWNWKVVKLLIWNKVKQRNRQCVDFMCDNKSLF